MQVKDLIIDLDDIFFGDNHSFDEALFDSGMYIGLY